MINAATRDAYPACSVRPTQPAASADASNATIRNQHCRGCDMTCGLVSDSDRPRLPHGREWADRGGRQLRQLDGSTVPILGRGESPRPPGSARRCRGSPPGRSVLHDRPCPAAAVLILGRGESPRPPVRCRAYALRTPDSNGFVTVGTRLAAVFTADPLGSDGQQRSADGHSTKGARGSTAGCLPNLCVNADSGSRSW